MDDMATFRNAKVVPSRLQGQRPEVRRGRMPVRTVTAWVAFVLAAWLSGASLEAPALAQGVVGQTESGGRVTLPNLNPRSTDGSRTRMIPRRDPISDAEIRRLRSLRDTSEGHADDL